ncbi:hypothetical protein CRG98_038732 [Punica granatum]|uniref:Uncharacterized protein n=1 Tax=Punica granatum TaxID=22663 RepID=A0A2I0IA81_PUNGR|nr:hypothetical protein CRG98_038732 [Punica granatum]
MAHDLFEKDSKVQGLIWKMKNAARTKRKQLKKFLGMFGKKKGIREVGSGQALDRVEADPTGEENAGEENGGCSWTKVGYGFGGRVPRDVERLLTSLGADLEWLEPVLFRKEKKNSDMTGKEQRGGRCAKLVCRVPGAEVACRSRVGLVLSRREDRR